MQMNQVWKTTEKELLRDRSHLKYQLPIVLLLDYSYIIRYHDRKKKTLGTSNENASPIMERLQITFVNIKPKLIQLFHISTKKTKLSIDNAMS